LRPVKRIRKIQIGAIVQNLAADMRFQAGTDFKRAAHIN